jgi:gluconate:H+ symporter, GntP family
MPFFAAAAAGQADLWPFAILGISVAFVVGAIALFRVHAFVALILAAILVGLLSTELPELPGRTGTSHLVKAIELPTVEFGRAAGNIGLVIALASIIGVCLMESGAADKIVRRFIRTLGEGRAAVALLCSGFFLSIPVFFDTVFFLLIPLARALALRTGRDYTLYVLAICGGGVITHSMVPPTPGPLLVVEGLGLDLGQVIVVGLIAGILPAVGVLYTARFLNARVRVPLREVSGASLADLNAIVSRKEDDLPSFGVSILPVIVPVLLITLASFMAMALKSLPEVVSALGGPEAFGALYRWVEFLGNKNTALLIGAVIALGILAYQKSLRFSNLGAVMGPPLETAGVIILITAAGGAFGAMIRHSGVGETIRLMAEGRELNYVLLAWAVTAVVRVAQGSATVAMITGVGLMAAVIGDGSQLGFHPVYIFLAIGFGSIILSWMNDSGFWVVGKLSGFTERETLKTWTVLLTMISLVGLIQCLIFAKLIPFPMAF